MPPADPTSSASVPPPTAMTPPTGLPRRPWTILGRLSKAVRAQNWFAVGLELVIVVLGVVIGFQVTAWGQARSDRAREQEHLRQLAADLAETERLMARADSVSLPWERAGNRLWAAFYEETPPTRDSLMWWRVWSDSYVTDDRPLLGTAEALIATGDLALIRDDSLRAGIVAYVEETRSVMENQARLITQWHEAQTAINRGIDNGEIARMLTETSPAFMDAVRSVDPTFTFPDDARVRFPLRPDALVEDQTLAQAAWTMRNARANLRSGRRTIRDAAATLRQQIQAELDP